MMSGEPMPNDLKNRLLLYGPPGNGKTTISKKMAEEAGCHIIYTNAPELVSKYHGGSAENVKQLFDAAYEHAEKNYQPVVIVIDEIDALAANVGSEQRAEALAALQELWHKLDAMQDDPRFFFIGLTNKKELHPTFKTRFGNNIEKIDAPDETTRKAVLQLYINQYSHKPWKQEIIKELVQASHSKTLGIRFLEDFIREVHMVAKNDYDGKMTKGLVLKIFYEMKAKYDYVEGWGEWTKRIMSENKTTIVSTSFQLAITTSVSAAIGAISLCLGLKNSKQKDKEKLIKIFS